MFEPVNGHESEFRARLPIPDASQIQQTVPNAVMVQVIDYLNVGQSRQVQREKIALQTQIARRQEAPVTSLDEEDRIEHGPGTTRFTVRDSAGTMCFLVFDDQAPANVGLASQLIVHSAARLWRGVLLLRPRDVTVLSSGKTPGPVAQLARLEDIH